MKKPIKNMAASVRARIEKFARTEGKSFDSVLVLYFLERLLARLAASSHRDRFVLKGALLIFATAPEKDRLRSRPTKDVDFLGRKLTADLEGIASVFREVAEIAINDGVVFDAKTVVAERIKEDADYEGVRAHVVARLGQAKTRLQIDVGFGDVVTPRVLKIKYPVLLDGDSPELWCYPFESVVAEKFEAMIKLATLNSRMKDFYDVYHIAGAQPFDGDVLQEALRKTFERRGTEMDPTTPVLGEAFRIDPARQKMWANYLRKARLGGAPDSFAAVMQAVIAFVGPVFGACCSGAAFRGRWFPGNRTWKRE